jgi:hypothetical protein
MRLLPATDQPDEGEWRLQLSCALDEFNELALRFFVPTFIQTIDDNDEGVCDPVGVVRSKVEEWLNNELAELDLKLGGQDERVPGNALGDDTLVMLVIDGQLAGQRWDDTERISALLCILCA